ALGGRELAERDDRGIALLERREGLPRAQERALAPGRLGSQVGGRHVGLDGVSMLAGGAMALAQPEGGLGGSGGIGVVEGLLQQRARLFPLPFRQEQPALAEGGALRPRGRRVVPPKPRVDVQRLVPLATRLIALPEEQERARQPRVPR